MKIIPILKNPRMVTFHRLITIKMPRGKLGDVASRHIPKITLLNLQKINNYYESSLYYLYAIMRP